MSTQRSTQPGTSPPVSSLTKQAVWLMVARTAGFVFSFALPLILVRTLSTVEFGLYRQAFLLVLTAVNILPMGFHVSAFYYLPRAGKDRPAIVLNIVIFLAGAALLLLLPLIFWPEVLRHIFGNGSLVALAPLIGAVGLTWILSSFLEVVATANQDVKASTIFIIAAQLSKTALMVFAAIYAASLKGLLWAALIQGLLQTAILLVYLERSFPGFLRSFQLKLFRDQAAYALPFGFAGVLYTLQSDFHSYLVANTFSPADFAIYSIGIAQLPLVNVLRDSMGTVLIPRISSLEQDGRHREVVELTLRTVRKLAAFYLPIYGCLMVLAREFIVVLFTAKYVASWPIFSINLTMLLLNIWTSDPILRAYASWRFYTLKFRILLLAILVPVSIPVVQQFGLIGGAVMFVLGMMTERLFLFGVAMRAAGIRKPDWRELSHLPRFAVAAVLAAVVTVALKYSLVELLPPLAILALCGAVYIAIYAVLIAAMGALATEEKALINGISERFLGVRVLPLGTGAAAARRKPAAAHDGDGSSGGLQ